jgi:hypothetical protein
MNNKEVVPEFLEKLYPFPEKTQIFLPFISYLSPSFLLLCITSQFPREKFM